jgi:hypothetical protein
MEGVAEFLEARRVTGQLSVSDGFCDSRREPSPAGSTSVQNPWPKPTSHNQRCHRVLQRQRPGTPARPCSRLHRRPAAHLQVDALTTAGTVQRWPWRPGQPRRRRPAWLRRSQTRVSGARPPPRQIDQLAKRCRCPPHAREPASRRSRPRIATRTRALPLTLHQPRDAGQLAVPRETAAKLLPNRPDDLALGAERWRKWLADLGR